MKSIFESNYAMLQELNSKRETLAGMNIFVAATVGEMETVRSMLDENYPARQQEIAKLLLKHGAEADNARRMVELRGQGTSYR